MQFLYFLTNLKLIWIIYLRILRYEILFLIQDKDKFEYSEVFECR